MLKALFYPNVPFETLYIPHILKEVYFDKVYADIVTKRSSVIIDIGANIGLVTQYLRNYASMVLSIEPATEHFEALRRNKDFNEWDNVNIYQLAIADKDGQALFNTNSGNHTMNSLVFGGDGQHVVETLTLESFLAQHYPEGPIDFIKMDVEGAEDLILGSEGFKNVIDRIKAIEIEFHAGDWMKWNEYFESEGFVWKQFPTDATVVLYQRSSND
jgi:FkbM family methyltransferase